MGAYKLFGSNGPEVSIEQTHRSRLDELSKCLAVAPADASVRLFWADAVVSIAGPEMAYWTYFIGSRAPSEQGMARLLVQNIEAAWRGNWWTRSFQQAKEAVDACQDWNAVGASQDTSAEHSDEHGQPVPGVFVWKNVPLDGENWEQWNADGWPLRPIAESVDYFLTKLTYECGGSGTVVGVLLDVDGADLQFLSTQPLSAKGESGRGGPSTSVTVLGGPKGISGSVKQLIKDGFKAGQIPLVEVCLGPEEQMAHACVAYLRLQDDAGRFRPAICDLLNLGMQGYVRLRQLVDAALRSVSASLVMPTEDTNSTIDSVLVRPRSRSRSRSCASAK